MTASNELAKESLKNGRKNVKRHSTEFSVETPPRFRMINPSKGFVKGKKPVQVNWISVKVCDELYALIANEADATGKALIDVVVQAVADKFKRPELGVVPRKSVGRPRQKALAEAV